MAPVGGAVGGGGLEVGGVKTKLEGVKTATKTSVSKLASMRVEG